jgi:hypothetical protein
MEQQPSFQTPQPNIMSSPSDTSPTKNMIIIVLVVILVLSLLGINVFIIFGNVVQRLIDIFNPIVSKTLSDLGYTSGTLLGSTADISADALKTGIDILNDTVQSVEDLLLKASGKDIHLDKSINQPPLVAPLNPLPNSTTNPIQTPSSKQNWCLVGEYKGTRGCIEISEQDKCLSGQVFPNQQMCLNPTFSRR